MVLRKITFDNSVKYIKIDGQSHNEQTPPIPRVNIIDKLSKKNKKLIQKL